ncbi:alpha/beta hydrolase [Actinomadura rupiterrae]|uniref:alpha/beta hydrolase n=1 Tax=Actinomadura rupiterrae TaxID=559627 RepID=UPI0020A4B1F8|nr:alpha/beta hydrolase [Actinomadura rupiterrae]MCP2339656.1 pimeloyl-ACP methyl ester carboxylesterase [Actinomadura rupiterrae]
MKRLVIMAATAGLGVTALGATAASAATDSADAYKVSAVKWHACPADFVKTVATNYDPIFPVSKIVQCGYLQVPLDYAKPNGKKISLFVTRTPHTGASKAKGQIVVNPGGPGGAGGIFGPRVFAQNSPAMRAAYDVIGFDPRGVGASKPALSCDTGYGHEPRPDYGTGDARSEKIWLKRTYAYDAACKKADKIGLLKHIHTTDSARDLNTIRRALGNKKLDYYGASYGTYLGSVYATLFPTKVNRMVLDGVVGPSGVWYKANLDQDVAFNKNMEYYFGWLAKYDSTYHLGKTQKEVRSFFYGLRAKLAKKPVYSADKSAAVSSANLTDVIQNAGYRRSAGMWNMMGAGLAAYKKGDIATFVDTFGGPTNSPVDDNTFAVYNAVQCTDTQWPTSWKKWHNDNVRVNKKAPFLTWGNVWFNSPCLGWPAKAAKPVNVGAVKNLPKNILMFQATDDAATPYAGSLDMQRRLKSHLVIQDGDRTHCIVHRGSSAVDAYFDAYFLDGKLPSQRTVHVPQLGDPTPPAAGLRSAAVGGLLNDVIK